MGLSLGYKIRLDLVKLLTLAPIEDILCTQTTSDATNTNLDEGNCNMICKTWDNKKEKYVNMFVSGNPTLWHGFPEVPI